MAAVVLAHREWTVHEVISEGDDSIDKAEERLYGVLRHLITPTYEYGHVHWFVKAEGSPDGFTYKMFDREAEWIKEASEHE